MLLLKNITLTFFKNYTNANFQFDQQFVGITGSNGIGKTNLLDAIYYLCFTKSYLNSTDVSNIQFSKEGFRLQGKFSKNDEPMEVLCIHRGTKKEFLLNGIAYSKMAEHIGRLPAVIITPDDVELITGASENRRRYLDQIISQIDFHYLQSLITYNKLLQQRNSLLKQAAESAKLDIELLNILNDQMRQPAEYVHDQRKIHFEQLQKIAQQFYSHISDNKEALTLHYSTDLDDKKWDGLIKSSLEKDQILQRTTVGIHKDDIKFLLNHQPFKTIASQGQRKSLLFALKLAEFELLKNHNGFAPLLLLDDVFEKLDATRMNFLLQFVCQNTDAQVFITDTHQERLEEALMQLNIPNQIIHLE